jgi:hypothetical protein
MESYEILFMNNKMKEDFEIMKARAAIVTTIGYWLKMVSLPASTNGKGSTHSPINGTTITTGQFAGLLDDGSGSRLPLISLK